MEDILAAGRRITNPMVPVALTEELSGRYDRNMGYVGLLLTLAIGADPQTAPAEYTPEAMRLYGTKIQPLLATSCAACHSTNGCGSFSLRRYTPGVAIPLETTHYNIAAAAAQIDRKSPERSKLLVKAITAHGGARQPPLKDANTQAYKNLAQWVKLMANDGRAPSDPKAPNQPIDEFDPEIFNKQQKG